MGLDGPYPFSAKKITMTTSWLCKLIDLDNLILQGPIGTQQSTILLTKKIVAHPTKLCFLTIAAIPRWKLEAKLDNLIFVRGSCCLVVLRQIQHYSGLVSVTTIIPTTRLTFHDWKCLSESVAGRTECICPRLS